MNDRGIKQFTTEQGGQFSTHGSLKKTLISGFRDDQDILYDRPDPSVAKSLDSGIWVAWIDLNSVVAGTRKWQYGTGLGLPVRIGAGSDSSKNIKTRLSTRPDNPLITKTLCQWPGVSKLNPVP
ncbi:hypothetical protein PCANC_13484 [Puccinia coronata f. sp. avenae]|uniref:Uncharacterized protein n=1 Tax=Puccinia coronata f. sp. avenae TaxID=200324 RepID=A0A2N5V4K9_9BASI|nr:hypothetical protein PCASD_23774 [Puccinia coronata f. sp. avenae]PLW44933.1 hypothetical protein PCANC_13484 [Puccinia coronata f. sp. avenae]